MRKFENQVQLIKYETLREVAKFEFEGVLKENIEDIIYKVNKGPNPRFRCCIYHERATTRERIKMAMGGDLKIDNVIEVLDTACDECPSEAYRVSEGCRNCIANKCISVCPVSAIEIINKKAVIDYSKCIECGKCKKSCPYDAISEVKRPCVKVCQVNAIKMNENKKAVIDYSKCIECGACVYECPFGALQDKSEITEVIKNLKSEENIYAIVAPAFATQFPEASIGQVVKAIKLLGFRDVIEVALGADLIARHEGEEFIENIDKTNFMTSSCCPAFVKYIKLNYSELLNNVSNSVSPMVAIGKVIKRMDRNSKIVFIGPCIGKKSEKKLSHANKYIDYVLTFEELMALVDAKEIKLDDLEKAPLNNASYYGRMLATSGGLSKAIESTLNSDKKDLFKPVISDGIKECEKNLKLASFNKLKGNFIEGMACHGGCIKGPVASHHGNKDKKALKSYSEKAMEKESNDAVRIIELESVKLNIE